MGYRVGIVGASGYAGGELVRLVDGHPALDTEALVAAKSAGKMLRDVHPQLTGGHRRLEEFDRARLADLDLVFLALPHGASTDPALKLLELGGAVVDLGSDFRLDTAARYLEAYGTEHPVPDQLGRWPYGLPELFGSEIRGSDRVAVPGCYPTSALLALGPLLRLGAIEPTGIVVTSVSGVSGAGRSPSPSLQFGAVAEGVKAYGVLTHRHRPEIERALDTLGGTDSDVIFTPQLVPMQRGILSICHATMTGNLDPVEALMATYRDAPFVDVVDEPPQTRWLVGSNRALLSAHLDSRTGSVIVIAALDNLLKGAAGQAVQCANLLLGLPEPEGLPLEGWMP